MGIPGMVSLQQPAISHLYKVRQATSGTEAPRITTKDPNRVSESSKRLAWRT